MKYLFIIAFMLCIYSDVTANGFGRDLRFVGCAYPARKETCNFPSGVKWDAAKEAQHKANDEYLTKVLSEPRLSEQPPKNPHRQNADAK